MTYYVRLIHEFATLSTDMKSEEQIRNTTYLMKKGARWDEVRGYDPFPPQARLDSLAQAKRAANSKYIRVFSKGPGRRVEIVVKNDYGAYAVVWRSPALSALEQLALCAE